MKVLVVYDEEGNILSYQTSIEFKSQYNCIIEDLKSNRTLRGVDVQNKKIIWGDSEEMEKAKKELEKNKQEELELKMKLLILEKKAN